MKFFRRKEPTEIKPLTRSGMIKRTTLKWTLIFVVILAVFFAAFYWSSKFYDSNRVTFQNPVIFVLRAPVLITKRFILKDLPKAQYVDVNPLTTPEDIVRTVKNHGTFDYVRTEPVDTISRETVRSLLHNKVVQKWGEAAWPDIDYIIKHESNYDPYIVNKESGACGIFQALPCTKLPSLDITDQINWGVTYIEQRYGDAGSAAAFKKEKGWY